MAQSVSYEDFPKICRLCLKNDELTAINSLPEFVDSLKTITNIKVTPNDKLPKSVCKTCIEKLDNVNCFIETCRNSNTILKNILFQEEDKNAWRDMGAVLISNANIKLEPADEVQTKVENTEEYKEEKLTSAEIINNEHYNISTEKRTCEEEKVFTCSKCKKVFQSLASFKQHIKCHRKGSKNYEIVNKINGKCMHCNKYFSRKSDLQRHQCVHTGAKLYSCTICNIQFTQKTSLDRHNLLHSGKFKCPICNKPFTRESHLKNHIKTHNGKSIDAEYNKNLNCTFCEKKFSSKRYLISHMRMHTGARDFECDICHKVFPVKNSLTRHYLSHTQIKAYKCDQCNAAFNKEMLLQRHKICHDENSEEKRKLTCSICGKYFLFPSHLRRHAAVHDPSQKPFIYKRKSQTTATPGRFLCSYCGKQFSQVSNLSVHVRTHTGERFHCEICGKSYSTKDSLKIHHMAHRGEKPYPCPYCGKHFRKPNLYKHILIHKDIRRFKCDTCKKTFIRKDQLDQHLRVHS